MNLLMQEWNESLSASGAQLSANCGTTTMLGMSHLGVTVLQVQEPIRLPMRKVIYTRALWGERE